jgi:hypothetical protein
MGGSEDRSPLIINLVPDKCEWSASAPGPTEEVGGTTLASAEAIRTYVTSRL